MHKCPKEVQIQRAICHLQPISVWKELRKALGFSKEIHEYLSQYLSFSFLHLSPMTPYKCLQLEEVRGVEKARIHQI